MPTNSVAAASSTGPRTTRVGIIRHSAYAQGFGIPRGWMGLAFDLDQELPDAVELAPRCRCGCCCGEAGDCG
jgi:hypothetical protein